jgi:hypothetical protein
VTRANKSSREFGQFYTSTAVIGDGSARPEPQRDPELYHQASTVPGSHLPHVWVGDATTKLSTLDKFIGWRSMTLLDDPESALRAALRGLLSR